MLFHRLTIGGPLLVGNLPLRTFFFTFFFVPEKFNPVRSRTGQELLGFSTGCTETLTIHNKNNDNNANTDNNQHKKQQSTEYDPPHTNNTCTCTCNATRTTKKLKKSWAHHHPLYKYSASTWLVKKKVNFVAYLICDVFVTSLAQITTYSVHSVHYQ